MKHTALSFEMNAMISGKTERVRFSLTSPYPKETGEWACLFELSGVKGEEERHEYFGVDALQALILNLFYLRSVLARMRKKGYALYTVDTGEEVHPETLFDVFSKPA